jgi:hypothetical protein
LIVWGADSNQTSAMSGETVVVARLLLNEQFGPLGIGIGNPGRLNYSLASGHMRFGVWRNAKSKSSEGKP